MNPAAAPDLVPRHVAVNGDLERLLIAALTADSSNWEGGSVIVNGVSANRGSAWDVAGGRASIGYDPQDDVQERLRVAP